jgi:hypothetical protein
VDVKPANRDNTLDLKSRRVIPVAILASSDLDARNMIPSPCILDPMVQLKRAVTGTRKMWMAMAMWTSYCIFARKRVG